MPLPHFLALILAVTVLAGLTVWAVHSMALPLGVAIVLALVGALAVRTFAWR